MLFQGKYDLTTINSIGAGVRKQRLEIFRERNDI